LSVLPFIAIELERLKARWRDLTWEAAARRWRLPGWELPPGWSQASCTLWVPCPPAYPQAPPDNFFTEARLKLANGQDPGSSCLTTLEDGQQVRCFSFHVRAGWNPEQGDGLETFLFGVTQRLSEPS
jgi:hypothetical protein